MPWWIFWFQGTFVFLVEFVSDGKLTCNHYNQERVLVMKRKNEDLIFWMAGCVDVDRSVTKD